MKKISLGVFVFFLSFSSFYAYAQNQSSFLPHTSGIDQVVENVPFTQALQCIFNQKTLTCVDTNGTIISTSADGLREMMEKFFVCDFVRKNAFSLAFCLVFAYVMVNKGFEYGKKIMFKASAPQVYHTGEIDNEG